MAIFVVSILTRPQERVQRRPCQGSGTSDRCFNPHPPTGAGATCRTTRPPTSAFTVSILTRPQERVQLSGMRESLRTCKFQSSPAHRSGCNHHREGEGIRPPGFNPHPPTGAGATPSNLPTSPVRCSFNPHPPTGAGATATGSPPSGNSPKFQSSPAHRSGCNLSPPMVIPPDCLFQSSPAHRSGCN